jgi:hypothetical protein
MLYPLSYEGGGQERVSRSTQNRDAASHTGLPSFERRGYRSRTAARL